MLAPLVGQLAVHLYCTCGPAKSSHAYYTSNASNASNDRLTD